jgi:hypothetical protein
VTASVGVTFNAASSRRKNRQATSPSRRFETSVSMSCPCYVLDAIDLSADRAASDAV